MRALFRPPPTAADIEFFDLTPEEQNPPIIVWDCNRTTVNAFVSMLTQWRAGFSGAYGLDYCALPSVLELSGVPREQWPEIFEGVRVMEDVALDIFAANREREERRRKQRR